MTSQPLWVVRGRALLLALALTGSSSAAHAQSPISDLSIEDVMKLDGGQVFGATERLQPVMEAPASISFITAAEIARYGYRTLADILQSVRGFYVTNDRALTSLATRGFGKPGDFNSRVLLLIDGHRVNDTIFGAAEIGREFFIDTALIERVEVIRGPSSSIYGDSAFFAVVNVITRTGASLGGGAVTVEAGTLGTVLTRATAGHDFANGAQVALSGTYEHSNGVERLYFPAFDSPATNNGIAERLDGEGARQFYSRLDFKGLSVIGAYGRRQRDVPTASRGTLFNQQAFAEQLTDRHTMVDAAYHRTFNDTRVVLRSSFDRFSFDAILPLVAGPDASAALVAESVGVGTRWKVGGGVTRAIAGRHTVAAGVELIDNVHQDQASRFLDPPMLLSDSRLSTTQHAVYLQDELKVTRWLILNAGLRYDGYQQFNRVTPRTALIILPSAMQSVKYLFGNAFRAPSAYELNSFLFGERVQRLRPESIDTHELVWEGYLNEWLRTSVSTYWYKAARLITAVADPTTRGVISFVNEGQVRARGLELEAQMRLRGESRALFSYALQNAVNRETRTGVLNSPRHLAKARIGVPGPTPRSTVSIESQFLSSRTTLGGATVAPAMTVNVTLIQALARDWELSARVSNFFDEQYADPASSEHRQDTIPQNGRTARIGLRWRFWTR